MYEFALPLSLSLICLLTVRDQEVYQVSPTEQCISVEQDESSCFSARAEVHGYLKQAKKQLPDRSSKQ